MAARRKRPVVKTLVADEDVLGLPQRLGISTDRPVIVLFGGADGVVDQSATRLYPLVRDGVVAIAQKLGAAIVDGGTQSGVMELAGRARAELSSDIPLIGLRPVDLRVRAAALTLRSKGLPYEPLSSATSAA